nr:hypothetical protein [Marinicella sp. W31]MDC2876170.1 hypothetical protein [Marinicella sp. W31]
MTYVTTADIGPGGVAPDNIGKLTLNGLAFKAVPADGSGGDGTVSIDLEINDASTGGHVTHDLLTVEGYFIPTRNYNFMISGTMRTNGQYQLAKFGYLGSTAVDYGKFDTSQLDDQGNCKAEISTTDNNVANVYLTCTGF